MTKICQCYKLPVNKVNFLRIYSLSQIVGMHSHATYAKNVGARFLYSAYIPGELFWIDSNGKNGN